jgi:hypothetical protein
MAQDTWPECAPAVKPPVSYARLVAKDFLLVIADRKPLAWVLTDERMAFSRGSSHLASVGEGDRLFICDPPLFSQPTP